MLVRVLHVVHLVLVVVDELVGRAHAARGVPRAGGARHGRAASFLLVGADVVDDAIVAVAAVESMQGEGGSGRAPGPHTWARDGST